MKPDKKKYQKGHQKADQKRHDKQKKRKHVIMAWLKPYLETMADNETSEMWGQLKMHGEAKEWRKFGSVIRKKWQSLGGDFMETTCLDNSQHCVHIWDILTRARIGTDTEGYVDPGISDTTTEDTDINAGLTCISSTTNGHEGETSHSSTKNVKRYGGEPKGPTSKKTGNKQRQRKDILMAWFKPYMDMKPDDDTHRIWEELSMSARARNWAQFGNVIRRKWLETHMGDTETTTFLDNASHCRNVWEILSRCGYEPKGPTPKITGNKQRQRKDILMAWFKPYMDMKPDHDAHRIWEELSMYAGARNWAQFGNVIRRKWVEARLGHTETTTFLDNASHCRNVWEILNR